jgi:DNA-directed RNA polymerase specialized sigma24 family protein
VFTLREMEEMETEQICRDLNISPNNLWVMLHRARMALRECLEMNWFKDPQQEGG